MGLGMTDYNPFEKQLKEIVAGDLEVLTSVHEGWYVEYKRQLPNAASIAKSVSAFANTYGGWLFYGIEEKSKTEPVAGKFPGILRSDLDAALQSLRQAVAGSVTPSPHYEVAVVWGPDSKIDLEADRAIICVWIPSGHEAPFVHKSGMIYRRVADGSEPKPETDRFILDQLWRRGAKVRKEYRRWIGKDLELSKGESKSPYFRLFITPDLWRDKNVWAELTIDQAQKIFGCQFDETTFSTTPFDTVYKNGSGFVGRQAKLNDPHAMSMTWFLSKNLTSEIIIPLPCIEDIHVDHVHQHLDGYENAVGFRDALRAFGHNSPKIIDLNFLFKTLLGIYHIQSLLDKAADRSGPLFVKGQLINVWRTRPFVDVSDVVEYQQKHGVPVCMTARMFTPPGRDPDHFALISDNLWIKEPKGRKLRQAMDTFDLVANAVGIETGWDFEPDDEGNKPLIHWKLAEAGNRALRAQELRNERNERLSRL